MRLAKQLSDGIARITICFGGITVAVMCLHVSAEVLSRALTGKPLPGTIDIVSFYYMVIVTFLPLAFVQTRNAHLSVDILVPLLPPPLRKTVDFIANVITIGTVALFLSGAAYMALEQTHNQEMFEAGFFDLPIWPSRWIVAIGFGAMLIVLLIHIGNSATGHTAQRADNRTLTIERE